MIFKDQHQQARTARAVLPPPLRHLITTNRVGDLRPTDAFFNLVDGKIPVASSEILLARIAASIWGFHREARVADVISVLDSDNLGRVARILTFLAQPTRPDTHAALDAWLDELEAL